jgi:hypothetical protein
VAVEVVEVDLVLVVLGVRVGALVDEVDRQALVEEGHLLEARPDRLEVVDGRLEDLRAGPEGDRRAGVVAASILASGAVARRGRR